MAKYKVLSTKKLDPSLVARAKENGIEIVQQEFISIRPVWNPETYEQIVSYPQRGLLTAAITSANAVSILNDYMVAEKSCWVLAWDFFCIQGKTKKTIQVAPFLQAARIAGVAANSSSLANEIIHQGVKEIIFFCGDKRREELPIQLKESGIVVHEVILYETVSTPIAVTEDYDAVLFFSPSGVQSFFAANELKPESVCFAIGPTTSHSINTFTQGKVISSLAPDPKEVVNDVIEHFKHKSTVG